MSDLVETLSNVFATPPALPAEQSLAEGISAVAYWSFHPSVEVVVARAEREPTASQVSSAWRRRLAGRPIPLVVLIDGGSEEITVAGPSGNPPPIVSCAKEGRGQRLLSSVRGHVMIEEMAGGRLAAVAAVGRGQTLDFDEV